jgi:hypothetical protein
VAERGLAFMRANLQPEMRSTAFEPEQPAPEGADAYSGQGTCPLTGTPSEASDGTTSGGLDAR